MLFGGATVSCNTGIIDTLTQLERQNTGFAATHTLRQNGGSLYLLGSPTVNLAASAGTFVSATGAVDTINTVAGPRPRMIVSGILPANSPGCVPPPPPPAPSTTPPPRQDNTLLLLILLLSSGGLGGGGRGGSSLQSLLPLLLLSGAGGGGI